MTKPNLERIFRRTAGREMRTFGSFKGNSSRKNSSTSDEIWVCDVCKVQYGNPDDAEIAEDWYPCMGCAKKFHDSCAQNNGVLDDGDVFNCKICITKTNN
jgi:hypothetical protein